MRHRARATLARSLRSAWHDVGWNRGVRFFVVTLSSSKGDERTEILARRSLP